MSTTETVLLIVVAGLVVLILGNIAFQVGAKEPADLGLPWAIGWFAYRRKNRVALNAA